MSQSTPDRFRLPDTATEAALAFYYSSSQARNLFAEFMRALQNLDAVRLIAVRMMLDLNADSHKSYLDEHRQEFRDELKREKGLDEQEADKAIDDMNNFAVLVLEGSRNALVVVAEHLQVILQMLLVRIYDAFYVYAEETVEAIYTALPAAIQSARGSYNNILTSLANQRIQNLVRATQKENLFKEMREILGLSWLQNDDDRARETLVAEMRNTITHNRAIINRKFVNKVQKLLTIPLLISASRFSWIPTW